MMHTGWVIFIVLLSLNISCRREEKFPAIAEKLATPIDVGVSENGNYFYVLNTDLDRTYNAGSVLVLDKEGERIRAVTIPRLARSMSIAGNDMLITVNNPATSRDPNDYKVILLDISDPATPKITKTWDISCRPINGLLKKDYKYFAVTCESGGFLLGILADDRSQSTLKLVRDYYGTKRAIHIDPERDLIFLFSTVLGAGQDDAYRKDMEFEDTKTYDEKFKSTDVPNEIPDGYEYPKENARKYYWDKQKFQFVVYNIKEESSAATPFPYRAEPDKDGVYKKELRWLYFTLSNFDGQPDFDAGVNDLAKKIYRQNFWDAEPDPDNGSQFYLSHRGKSPSYNSNEIVKVSIVGDLIGTDPTTVPVTSDVLEFERVYGFAGEWIPEHFPGSFKIQYINNTKVLLVNHFRDLVAWSRKEAYYAIAGKIMSDSSLGQLEWTNNCVSTEPDSSFYQLAVNQEGRAITGSYYGNAVIFLDIVPPGDIKVIRRVE